MPRRVSALPTHSTYHSNIPAARSREDKTRNSPRNAKQNPNQNQETLSLGFFSIETLKRDLEHKFPDSDLDFVLHSDEPSESQLLGNGCGAFCIGRDTRYEYGMDTISRLLKIIDLFCKRAL